MNGDAGLGELFRVHVAARSRAEENNVLEAAARGGEPSWQLGVVDNRNLGVSKDGRQRVRRHIGVAIDVDREIALASQLFSDRGKGVVGIDENSPQFLLPSREPSCDGARWCLL